MGNKLSASDKIEVAKIWHLPGALQQLSSASELLKKAQEGWCILNSCDGDRSLVEKAPILQVCEANVAVDMALEHIRSMEDMLNGHS